jgi:hypothetical protein
MAGTDRIPDDPAAPGTSERHEDADTDTGRTTLPRRPELWVQTAVTSDRIQRVPGRIDTAVQQPVHLPGPAQASGAATLCGMVLDEIDDFRLVVDEICTALVEIDGGSSLYLAFRRAGSTLVVEASTVSARELDDGRLALSDQILDRLAEWHQRRQDGQRSEITVAVRLRAAGVG